MKSESGMKSGESTGKLSKCKFEVKLESIYDKDREWKIEKCYREVVKIEEMFNKALKGRRDGGIKVSKKA